MNAWNATTYEGKDTILRVVREEADRFIDLAGRPGAWDAPTACESWSVRDVVGHLVDTTEGYFEAFETARAGGEASAYGLTGMHERAGEQAQRFGDLSQQEMLGRLRTDLDKLMGILQPMGPEEWTGFMVPHFYMGPVPAFFYAAGQLMDYAVHSWDIRQGTGRAHGLSGDAADLLVPFMFVLWQSTIRQDADLTPFRVGITVTGRNAGAVPDRRIGPGDELRAGRASATCRRSSTSTPGSLVLTTFGRSNSGTVRGDQDIADRYLNLFFRI